MKFKIMDLIVITFIVALMVTVFRFDRIFFRQLIWFALVSTGSTSAVLLIRRHKKAAVTSAMGGFVGGSIYAMLTLAILWLIPNVLFESPTRTVYPFVFESIFMAMLAIIFGSAIGVLFGLRLKPVQMPDEFQASQKFSWLILGGLFLIGLFAMFDRNSSFGMQRDWTPVSVILIAVYVIHTLQWYNRFELLQPPEPLASSPNSDGSPN